MKSMRVTASEFQKEYGRYASLARRQAVTITNHGRAELVVLDAEEYERLRRLDSRVACAPQSRRSGHSRDVRPFFDRRLIEIRNVLSTDPQRCLVGNHQATHVGLDNRGCKMASVLLVTSAEPRPIRKSELREVKAKAPLRCHVEQLDQLTTTQPLRGPLVEGRT